MTSLNFYNFSGYPLLYIITKSLISEVKDRKRSLVTMGHGSTVEGLENIVLLVDNVRITAWR
jgi:hypothetical protein